MRFGETVDRGRIGMSVEIQGRTTCAQCGALLDQTLAGLPDRVPCLKCGSTSRNVRVLMTETLAADDSLIAEAVSGVALAVQTVLLRGDSTDEGEIIKAVTLPWFEIVRLVVKDPSKIHEIPPRLWEEIIAGAYERAGFEEVILTPRSGDFGRDVIATKRALGTIRVIDQVKAFKPGHLVTANDVRALVGVLALDGASKGFVTTTSDFAPMLAKDPLIAPLIPSRLGLIDGVQLVARLRDLAD